MLLWVNKGNHCVEICLGPPPQKKALLPYLQLGPVPYKTFSFVAYSLKALSIARRYIIDGLSNHEALSEIPLWHSVIFKLDKHLTY